jgi:hypothetical protein
MVRTIHLLLLLVLLAACSTTPTTPVAERPTAQVETSVAGTIVAAATVPAPTAVSTDTPVETVPRVATVATTGAPVEVPAEATTTPVTILVPTATPAEPGSTSTPALSESTSMPVVSEPTSTPGTGSTTPDVAIGNVPPITYTVPITFQPSASNVFASFKLNQPEVTPRSNVPAIATDLSNVVVPFILSDEQRQLLGKQGFAISPGETKEFYELYERARYNYEPVFVTSDSLLHVYHLLFDRTLRVAEQEHFVPMLAALDWAMLNTSLDQLAALEGTPLETAALRNAAYFAVAVKLLDPSWEVPEGLRNLTDPELAAIRKHEGFSPSAIFPAYPYGEDWSQYVPRGHYTRSEELKRYFRAMMWHGRMTLRQGNITEAQQSALMTQAWQHTRVDDRDAAAVWHGIYDPTVFFVGRSDDLAPTEYADAFEGAFGATDDPRALLDESKFGVFQATIAELRPPEILGMVIDRNADVEETTKGLRFMGQRFVPDSFIFRQLIDDNVPGRKLPKGLDLFAVMGSERALEHLEASGDTKMPKYAEQFRKIQQIVAGYDDATWTQNLYWSWIHSLRPMMEPVGDGYPQFMRSDAWLDKQLNTMLGSWSELRHDTLLYAKQVYSEMGAGALPPPVPEPPKGYVEPVPEVYARISAIARMTIDGLKERGLLLPGDEQALAQMVEIADRLQTISEKELRGEALTDEEYEKIRFYGGDLERLTFAAGLEANEAPGGSPASDAPQAAVVADVATNPGSGIVLEEGVGRVFPIYAVVPIEGKLTVTVGGVFSHYEFEQPMSDRLTDEAWQQMLDEGKAPAFEPWKQALMVEETPAKALADTIRSFNDGLTEALWLTDISSVQNFLDEPELGDTQRYIDQLKGRGEFVGLKRLSLEYLTFDLQDATHATVTTRERFFEELRKGSPIEFTTPPPVIGVRAPYESTVAYTLVNEGETWKINKIVVNNPPGDWQQP